MKYYFQIALSADEVMPYYRGQVSTVVAFATNGQRIQFQAMHLRKFMTPSGVYGRFCLETENNKFVALTKIS